MRDSAHTCRVEGLNGLSQNNRDFADPLKRCTLLDERPRFLRMESVAVIMRDIDIKAVLKPASSTIPLSLRDVIADSYQHSLNPMP